MKVALNDPDFGDIKSLDNVSRRALDDAHQNYMETATPTDKDMSEDWKPLRSHIKLMNVPWEAGYQNTVGWKSEDARNAWFDAKSEGTVEVDTNWNFKTLEIYKPALGKYEGNIRVPLPLETAMAFNYIYVKLYNQPVKPYATKLRDHYFYHVTAATKADANETELTLELDAWTEYINSVSIQAVNLARGHYPMLSITATDYLKDPLHCKWQLSVPEPDLPANDSHTMVTHEEFHPIYDDHPLAIIATTADFSNPGSFWSNGKVPPNLPPDWWLDPNNLDPKNDPYVQNTKETVETYNPLPISTKAYRVGTQKIDDDTGKAPDVPVTPVDPSDSNNLQNITNLQHFAIEPSQMNDFRKILNDKYPQAIPSLKALFVIPARFVSLGNKFSFEGIGMQAAVPSIGWKSLGSMGITKDIFGYPADCADYAKMYAAQFASIEISSMNGEPISFSVEDLAGDLEVYARANTVFPFLKFECFVDGVGGKSIKKYAIKPVVDMKAEMPQGLWEAVHTEWNIPTYAMFADHASTAIDNYANWWFQLDEARKMLQRGYYERDVDYYNSLNDLNKEYEIACDTAAVSEDNSNESNSNTWKNAKESAVNTERVSNRSNSNTLANAKKSATNTKTTSNNSNNNALKVAKEAAGNTRTNANAENHNTKTNADNAARLAKSNGDASANTALKNTKASASTAQKNGNASNDAAWQSAKASALTTKNNGNASNNTAQANGNRLQNMSKSLGDKNAAFIHSSSARSIAYDKKMKNIEVSYANGMYNQQVRWLQDRNNTRHAFASIGIPAGTGVHFLGQRTGTWFVNHAVDNEQSTTDNVTKPTSPQRASTANQSGEEMEGDGIDVAGTTPGDITTAADWVRDMITQEGLVNSQLGVQFNYDRQELKFAQQQMEGQNDEAITATVDYNTTQNDLTQENTKTNVETQTSTAKQNISATHGTTAGNITDSYNTAVANADRSHSTTAENISRDYTTQTGNAQATHDTEIANILASYNNAMLTNSNNYNVRAGVITNDYNTAVDIAQRNHDTTATNILDNYNTAVAIAQNNFDTTQQNIKDNFTTANDISKANYNTQKDIILLNYKLSRSIAECNYGIGNININNVYDLKTYEADQDWILAKERVQSEMDAAREGEPLEITHSTGDGAAEQAGMRGVDFRVRRINTANAEQVAKTFRRYGYRMGENTWIDHPQLALGKEYTYWECRDVWLTSDDSSEEPRRFIMDILKQGTTVWSDPDHVKETGLQGDTK